MLLRQAQLFFEPNQPQAIANHQQTRPHIGKHSMGLAREAHKTRQFTLMSSDLVLLRVEMSEKRFLQSMDARMLLSTAVLLDHGDALTDDQAGISV